MEPTTVTWGVQEEYVEKTSITEFPFVDARRLDDIPVLANVSFLALHQKEQIARVAAILPDVEPKDEECHAPKDTILTAAVRIVWAAQPPRRHCHVHPQQREFPTGGECA
jgi:hypothetical protein